MRNLLFTISLVLMISISGYPESDFPALRGPYLGQDPPGETPLLFAPGIISTCDLHSSLYFSPDGLEVYYSRLSEPEVSGIYFMKETDGIWSQPKFVENSGIKGLTPYLSPDGKKLFCSIGGNLYSQDRTSSGWSDSINLGSLINFQRRQDGPSVSKNNTLYFSTMFGNRDGMYRSEYKHGSYLEPEKLDIHVEGNRLLGYPVVAPDESYIIFTSWTDKTGYGMQDLYITFRRENGTWGKPRNLGKKINTQHSESFPFVTRDGRFLFFNSNRPSELNAKRMGQFYGNIYWVDAKIIEEFKPEEIREAVEQQL